MAKKIKKNERKKTKPLDKSSIHLIGINSKDERDNGIYQSNIQALREHYPELVNRIEDTPLNHRFQLRRTGDEATLNLYCQEGNFYYYDNDRPNKDVADQIKFLRLKNTRLAVFLGIGLGYELLYYIQNVAAKQNTSYILVIEKDIEVFKAALNSINFVSIIKNPGIRFLISEEDNNLYISLRAYLEEKNRFMLLKAVKAVYHPSSLRLNKDYYLKALQSLRDAAVQQVLHYGNDPYDSLIGIENMLSNIDEIVSNPGIDLLNNKFIGQPAIVVATGPSLNKNKHLLKGLEDKALIISADASLKILMQMNVKPHVVVSLERGIIVKELIEGFAAEEVSDVYYAVCPVVDPAVLEAYTGPKIMVYRTFDHFKWLGIDKGYLDIKVSAGNMAFKVAEALGCDPIILIGQDCAFSREGHTHALGTATSVNGYNPVIHAQGNKMEVMGNDGEPITTNAGWYAIIKAYEIDLKHYSGTCINSTEGGAFIPGTKVMPFQESIDHYIRDAFYPLNIIHSKLEKFTADQKRKDRERLLLLFDETEQDILAIIEDCRQGIELCKKYEKPLINLLKNTKDMELDIQQLTFIQDEVLFLQGKILARRRTFQLFLAHVLQSFLINFSININAIPEKYDDYRLALAESILRYEEWYAGTGDLSAICLKSLQQAKVALINSDIPS